MKYGRSSGKSVNHAVQHGSHTKCCNKGKDPELCYDHSVHAADNQTGHYRCQKADWDRNTLNR